MGLTANDLYSRKIVKSINRARLFLELLSVIELDESLIQLIELAESIAVSNNWKSKDELAQAIQESCDRLNSQPNQVIEEKSIFSNFVDASSASIDDEAQIVAANIYHRLLTSVQGYVQKRNFTHPTALKIKENAESNFKSFLFGTSQALDAVKLAQSNQHTAALNPVKE